MESVDSNPNHFVFPINLFPVRRNRQEGGLDYEIDS